MVSGKQDERDKGLGCQDPFPRHAPRELLFLKVSPLSQECYRQGTNPSTDDPLGMLIIPATVLSVPPCGVGACAGF